MSFTFPNMLATSAGVLATVCMNFTMWFKLSNTTQRANHVSKNTTSLQGCTTNPYTFFNAASDLLL